MKFYGPDMFCFGDTGESVSYLWLPYLVLHRKELRNTKLPVKSKWFDHLC